jgi:hypothetical protein
MLEIIGMIFTGVFSGGATGLLGVLLQRYFDFKNRQQDIEIVKLNLANSIELSKMESERLKTRLDSERDIAEIEGRTEEYVSDNKLIEASYENDQASYIDKEALRKPGKAAGFVLVIMGIVDFLRGILRPGMTIYLCVVVTMMFFWARDLMQQNNTLLTASALESLVMQIITTILYVFTTASVWWYGARGTYNGTKK